MFDSVNNLLQALPLTSKPKQKKVLPSLLKTDEFVLSKIPNVYYVTTNTEGEGDTSGSCL